MKKLSVLFLAIFAGVAFAFADTTKYYGDVNNDGKVNIADICAMIEILNNRTSDTYNLTLADVDKSGKIDTSDLTLLADYVYEAKQLEEYVPFDGNITVTYSGTTATVAGLPSDGTVTANIDGANVTLTNNITTQEITTTLTGSTTDGSFTYNGSYKTTIVLNGVDITSTKGAAIDIECGKRIALEIKKGTENHLVDCANGSQKAALYCKGHLEIDKAGTLYVTGNTAHAISAKEYIQLKKSDGIINILGAVKDGIHCKQYFLGKGFTVNISGVKDDGIQVELDGETADAAIEDEYYLDGTFNIQDGTYNITTTANASKGINAAGSVNISGGTFTFTQTGSYTFDGTEMSYVTAIKSDCNINITGGNITINNTADGGKGLSADGNVNISGSATVLDITANANGGSAVVNSTGSSSGDTQEKPKTYQIYVALPTTGSSSQGGPGGQPGQMGQSAYWTNLYLYKSDGTKVAQLTNTVTLTSGTNSRTFYVYDFGAVSSDTYYFMSDNYTSRGGGGGQGGPQGGSGTVYAIKSGTFTGPTSGLDYYYEISSSYTTSGTTRTFAVSNVTNTWNGSEASGDATGEAYKSMGIKADKTVTISDGTVTIKNGTGVIARGIMANDIVTDGGTLTITNGGTGLQGTNDSWTAKGLHADTSIALNGGSISISMTGNGGKGIDSDGTYTQGVSGGSGPTLTVTTTGSSFGTSSSQGGQPGGQPGGMGGETSTGSSAKAIKAEGYVIVYGGTTVVTTASDGAEGLESKTSINIAGGNHYFKCYDDCINSAGQITFSGGNTVCYSFGNDAVDSNYGRSGAITISGGNVFAYSSKGGAEEGLDCDNNSYITVTGGIAVSAGGSQGGGGGSSSGIGSSSQGYYLGSSPSSYGSTGYYTLCNTSGTPVCTYKFEGNVSNSLSLLTASNLGTGSVTVKYGTSAPTSCSLQVNNASGTGVFFVAPTVTTTSTTATVTAK